MFDGSSVVGYATIDGQAANQIDVPTIQAAIKAKFDPAPAVAAASSPAKKAAAIPPASTVTADVYNGGSTSGLATVVSNALAAKGYKAGQVTNATAQTQAVTAGTQVFYGTGASANAAEIAGYFGATAKALSSLPAGHVEVILGTGATVVPSGLTSAPAAQSAPATSAASSATSPAGNNGAAGGAVTVSSKAKYGIPCVY